MKALRAVVIGGVLGFVGLVALSVTLGQEANTDKPAKSAPAKVPEEPRYAFEMRNKPWAAVFEWLSDKTGLPFISKNAPPGGTFTFINPRIDGKESKKYTIAEIFDIV